MPIFFFQTQSDANVLFQACISSSHWKGTLHSAVQTNTLPQVEARCATAGILVSGDRLWSSLHKKAVSCSLSFPVKAKLKSEELLGEELHGLGEDIDILLAVSTTKSGCTWILN